MEIELERVLQDENRREIYKQISLSQFYLFGRRVKFYNDCT